MSDEDYYVYGKFDEKKSKSLNQKHIGKLLLHSIKADPLMQHILKDNFGMKNRQNAFMKK